MSRVAEVARASSRYHLQEGLLGVVARVLAVPVTRGVVVRRRHLAHHVQARKALRETDLCTSCGDKISQFAGERSVQI